MSGWRRVPRQLGDDGVNDPKNWDTPFGTGEVHIGVSAFSDSEEKRRRTLAIAREQYEGFSGVSVLAMQDFGAQPGDLNSLGYKDGIDQPPIEGSGVDPLPGQGRPIKAGEFILGYPGEAGIPLPMPQPDILGRNGTYVGFRKYQSRVGAFNRFLRANGSTEEEQELIAAKLVGRWRSGAPLTLAPDVDNPALGADPTAEQRLQLRERPAWPSGAVRKPHSADEPARHGTHPSHRCQSASPHPARHDVWTAIRCERAIRTG